jgi:hypothetical protein
MTSAQRGPLVAGTWLIGIGVVFLIRQAYDLPWTQAWPLFVILVGVASLVQNGLSWRPSLPGLWTFTWPIVWIVVGVVLLLSTAGRLGTGPGELIAQGWPWLLVALGVWFVVGSLAPGGSRGTERLTLPLRGAADASVRIRFGAGTLTTRPASPGDLVDGVFDGGVIHRELGPGRVELSQDTSYGLPWLDRRSAWDLGLTGEVPLDLRLETGASRTALDLREIRLRRLDLQTGASETRVILPRNAGTTEVRAEHGAASLTFEVPAGVAARIRTRMTIGSSQIDEGRFPRAGDVYQSIDYGSAANRVDLDIQGGVGSLRVIGVP